MSKFESFWISWETIEFRIMFIMDTQKISIGVKIISRINDRINIGSFWRDLPYLIYVVNRDKENVDQPQQ